MTSQIEIIRSTKYTPVYEKGIKEARIKSMETTTVLSGPAAHSSCLILLGGGATRGFFENLVLILCDGKIIWRTRHHGSGG